MLIDMCIYSFGVCGYHVQARLIECVVVFSMYLCVYTDIQEYICISFVFKSFATALNLFVYSCVGR